MRPIDADALSKIMYRKAFEEDSDLQIWDSGCWTCYKMFEQALEEAPTVDAEPVHRGRWKRSGTKKFDFAFNCSECNSFSPYGVRTRYCPWCGAKMDGGTED